MICFAVSLKVICSFRQWIILHWSYDDSLLYWSDSRSTPIKWYIRSNGASTTKKNALVLQQEHLIF